MNESMAVLLTLAMLAVRTQLAVPYLSKPSDFFSSLSTFDEAKVS